MSHERPPRGVHSIRNPTTPRYRVIIMRRNIRNPWFITWDEWNIGTLGVFANMGARHFKKPQQDIVHGGAALPVATGRGDDRKLSLALFMGDPIMAGAARCGSVYESPLSCFGFFGACVGLVLIKSKCRILFGIIGASVG